MGEEACVQKGKRLFTSPLPHCINIAWDLGSRVLAKVAVMNTRGFPREGKASGRSLAPFFRVSTTMAGKLYMPRGEIANETQDVPGRVSKDVLAGVGVGGGGRVLAFNPKTVRRQ